MRTNLENSRTHGTRNFSMKFPSINQIISGTFVLPTEGPLVHVLSPAGTVTVQLPTLSQELMFVLANKGAGTINVVDSLGGAVLSLPPNDTCLLYSGATSWVVMRSGLGATNGARVVTATGAILTTDSIVQVNAVAPITLTLPTAASWLAVQGGRGIPLEIFDVSGNASTNNITIAGNGAETISSLASIVIGSNFGGFRLLPKIAGTAGWIWA